MSDLFDVKLDPTAKEVRVFGLLWLAFFGFLGLIAWWRPEGLIGAATFLGVAWIVSLIFNPMPRARQLAGIFLPGLLGGIGYAVLHTATPLATVLTVLGAVGGLGALAIWAAPALGKKLYVGWMVAALPVGWTISRFVLGFVFYVVLTPIGLLMRMTGYDPMKRKLDREASTYWIERPKAPEASRYFRQF